jgi:hypothetical protein
MGRVIGVCGVLAALFAVGIMAGRATTTSREPIVTSLPRAAVATISTVRVPELAVPATVTLLRPAQSKARTSASTAPGGQASSSASTPQTAVNLQATSIRTTTSSAATSPPPNSHKSGPSGGKSGTSGEVVSIGSGG